MNPSILIVEDNLPTCQRLQKIVEDSQLFEQCYVANTFENGQWFIQEKSPKVLLTDLGLPDGSGIDLIKLMQIEITETVPLSIVLTVFGDEGHVVEALRAGAMGYLLKDDNSIEISTAIRQMLKGDCPISPGIARHLLKELGLQKASNNSPVEPLLISARELEILNLVCKGFTSKEIGHFLDISYHTVSSHIKKVYRKLSVNNKAEAIYEARRNGWLD